MVVSFTKKIKKQVVTHNFKFMVEIIVFWSKLAS